MQLVRVLVFFQMLRLMLFVEQVKMLKRSPCFRYSALASFQPLH